MMNSPYYSSYQQGGGSVRNNKAPAGMFVPGTGVGQTRNAAPSGVKNSRPIMPVTQPRLTPKQVKKLEKQRRKERDHFYVMRKFICFLLFLFFLRIFTASAIGIVTKFVALPGQIFGYNTYQNTAYYVKPDNTPIDQRTDGYIDTTEYISSSDSFFGAVKSLVKLAFFDNADGTSSSPQYDSDTEYLAAVDPALDPSLSMAAIIYKYAPLLLIIILLTSLICMIKAFIGMFGRRMFKRFGLASIIIFICSAALVIYGVIACGIADGAPKYVDEVLVSVLDFKKITSFVFSAFIGAPAVTPDPALTTAALPIEAGSGLIAILVLPIITLIFSFFARRKVPYSIFDK